MKAQIDKKAIVFFNNVCHQSETSIEKRLTIRQTTVKSMKSKSWFIDIKKLLWKYELGDIEECLKSPLPKLKWKTRVNQSLYKYWTEVIVNQATMYSFLNYLNVKKYEPGKIDALLKIEQNSVRDITRISIKLKLLCEVYVLQSIRASFNQNEVDPTCQMCTSNSETLDHFILERPMLSAFRKPVLCDISNEYNNLNCSPSRFHSLCKEEHLKIILDCSYLTNSLRNNRQSEKLLLQLQTIEFLTRRLVHNLHCARYRMIKEVPMRRR